MLALWGEETVARWPLNRASSTLVLWWDAQRNNNGQGFGSTGTGDAGVDVDVVVIGHPRMVFCDRNVRIVNATGSRRW